MSLSENLLKEVNMSGVKENSSILDFYSGKSIFITGASGYVGTLLVEKLLRSCKSLKTLFLLFRETKKQNINDRLTEYFNDEVFSRMKLENPNYSTQVHIMPGDLQQERYGLSKEDEELLIQDTDVIFHVAATVRFDEHIRVAYDINVKGTRTLLNLSEQMKRLVSFIYVSTAYSNNELKHIEEKVYDPMYTEAELSNLLLASTDEEQAILNNIILGRKCNTYTLTKSTAESIVRDKMASLPISIMRPSVIMPTFREPIPLYYKGLNALSALTLGVGMGIIRVHHIVETIRIDIVPGDRTINALVALGWYNGNFREKIQSGVFNYVSINDNPITFKYFNQLGIDSLEKAKENLPRTLWRGHSLLVQNGILFSILKNLLHLLPCLIFVPIETRFKKDSQLLKVYRRLWNFREAIGFFCQNEWQFVNDNMKAVLSCLSEEDRGSFDFDLRNFEWTDHLAFIARSLSKYTLKEQVTKEGYKKKMYYIVLFEKIVSWFFAIGLVYLFCYLLATLLTSIFYGTPG